MTQAGTQHTGVAAGCLMPCWLVSAVRGGWWDWSCWYRQCPGSLRRKENGDVACRKTNRRRLGQSQGGLGIFLIWLKGIVLVVWSF